MSNLIPALYRKARQEGIEPPTWSLEGSCSIQLSYWRLVGKEPKSSSHVPVHIARYIGAAGFEPATSCSQSRRDTGLRYAPRTEPES